MLHDQDIPGEVTECCMAVINHAVVEFVCESFYRLGCNFMKARLWRSWLPIMTPQVSILHFKDLYPWGHCDLDAPSTLSQLNSLSSPLPFFCWVFFPHQCVYCWDSEFLTPAHSPSSNESRLWLDQCCVWHFNWTLRFPSLTCPFRFDCCLTFM